MLGPGKRAGVLMPFEIIVHIRIRRQQAEKLGIVTEEDKEVEVPLRRQRVGMAEAWRKMQACLPQELQDSL